MALVYRMNFLITEYVATARVQKLSEQYFTTESYINKVSALDSISFDDSVADKHQASRLLLIKQFNDFQQKQFPDVPNQWGLESYDPSQLCYLGCQQGELTFLASGDTLVFGLKEVVTDKELAHRRMIAINKRVSTYMSKSMESQKLDHIRLRDKSKNHYFLEEGVI